MRLMTWRTALVSLVLVAVLTVSATSQEADPNAAPAAPAASAVTPEPAQSTAGGSEVVDITPLPPMQQTAGPELQRRMKTLVSVDFRQAPIEDVIKSLAEQADIDIVKGPAVTGTVTATLSNVPLEEAMESIFSVHGYGYATSESIVRIVPRNELAQYMIKLQTKIFRIAYADIEALNKAVTGLLSPQGKIALNTATGHMCITDTEDKIKVLDEFITEMDREIPQILVEARIYDVSCSAYLDLGFNWSAGTFTLFDSTTGLPIAGEMDPYGGAAFSSAIGQAPKSEFGVTLGVLNDDVDLQVMFTAAKDDIAARLLANPKILVLNGQEASIDIVTEIPYQELTQTSGGGNMGTTQFKEVGVKLLVTPKITRDGKVRLQLSPEFSVQTGTVPLVIPSGLATAITTPQPIVDNRKAMTTALIGDGQTVVIGGLRKRDVIQEISKVPILCDIPLLGALFKFKGEKAVNSELIVFVTPHIITDPSLSPSDTRKLEAMVGEFREPTPPTDSVDCGTPYED